MGDALTILQKSLVIIALILTFAATYYIILRSSEHIDRVLGVTGIMVMTRIQGLIIGAIAVNFKATGAWNIYAKRWLPAKLMKNRKDYI
jgi:multiple antibiotic resistance protein